MFWVHTPIGLELMSEDEERRRIDVQGILQMLISKATYNKNNSQKKVKQYVAVGTVRMFIEP